MYIISASKGQMGELAETTSLLRMRMGNCTEGSNPSLSTINPLKYELSRRLKEQLKSLAYPFTYKLRYFYQNLYNLILSLQTSYLLQASSPYIKYGPLLIWGLYRVLVYFKMGRSFEKIIPLFNLVAFNRDWYKFTHLFWHESNHK